MSSAVKFRDCTAIVGIAQTQFAKNLGPSEAELACTVITEAGAGDRPLLMVEHPLG